LRTLLLLEDATLDDWQNYSVHLFLNKPDATADTPITDPHFAGAFAFFDHPGHPGHSAASFLLDAAPALKRLQIDGGELQISAVLVPYEGRGQAAQLSVGRASLQIARDIVEPAG
jgi:tyrosinase